MIEITSYNNDGSGATSRVKIVPICGITSIDMDYNNFSIEVNLNNGKAIYNKYDKKEDFDLSVTNIRNAINAFENKYIEESKKTTKSTTKTKSTPAKTTKKTAEKKDTKE